VKVGDLVTLSKKSLVSPGPPPRFRHQMKVGIVLEEFCVQDQALRCHAYIKVMWGGGLLYEHPRDHVKKAKKV